MQQDCTQKWAPSTHSTNDVLGYLAAGNGRTLSYDLDGNMTHGGATTYTWDARNRLAPFGTTGFTYDSIGRRTQNATGTAFLYDDVNAVEELSGSTVTANLLTGLGVDELLTRTDSAGARNFLTGALGSTLALTDSSGAVQTQYSFGPFGLTTSTGAASSSTFQYTGRENDGTGMYYYRARYYNPTLGRFISEDPLQFGGGDIDFYEYVGDDPIGSTDPSGLAGVGSLTCVLAAICEPKPRHPHPLARRKPEPDEPDKRKRPEACKYIENPAPLLAWGAGLGAVGGAIGGFPEFGVGAVGGAYIGAHFGLLGGEGLWDMTHMATAWVCRE